MESNVVPFQYDNQEVRVLTDEENNPWWVAKDVCEILNIENYRDAVARLDEDERGSVKVDTPGGIQIMTSISESGLYTLIIRSNKPQAKPFRRWVTHEVLPQIRKTGSYSMDNALSVESARKAELCVREFSASMRMAKALGYSGRVRVIQANDMTTERIGLDPLEFFHVDQEEIPVTDGEEHPPSGIESNMFRFISTNCILDPAGIIQKQELYKRYSEYCKAIGIMPNSLPVFARKLYSLKNIGLRRISNNGVRTQMFTGIRLVEETIQ